MKVSSITGVVTSTKRIGQSRNGNPSFDVTLYDGVSTATYRTASDAALSYAIENSEYQGAPHTFSLDGDGRLTHEVI